MHVHPEGARYFVDSASRVVTDSDISQPHVHDIITSATEEVYRRLSEHKTLNASDIELYLKVEDPGRRLCMYYFVDHSTRMEFWLEAMSTQNPHFGSPCSMTQLGM